MQEKRYQVFISSTYEDLKEERRKILNVLLMANCIPAGMEAFVASDTEQFEVIKKVIDLCDYYILIIGKRYGSVNPKTGLSYTEMEYDYAKSKGIPVLVFAINESVELPACKEESTLEKIEKLKNFRYKALASTMGSIWKNVEELTSQVAVSIMHAQANNKRPGWIRATEKEQNSKAQNESLLKENFELKKSLITANNTIKNLMTPTDLAFEKCEYKIEYKFYESKTGYTRYYNSNVKLPDLFKAIATSMMDVSITESRIKSVIAQLISDTDTIHITNELTIKTILNQLKALDFIYSVWQNNTLYWGLTQKGTKVRNDMILIKNIEQQA